MAGEQKTSYGWIIVAVLLVMAFGLIETPIKPSGFLRPMIGYFAKSIWSLVEESRPAPTIQPEVATLTQDEVCALVYNYLNSKATSMTDIQKKIEVLSNLATAKPYFAANYLGNGKWQVKALGFGNNEGHWVFYYNAGLWNLYEASRTIEPANNDATLLLVYISAITK